MAADRRRMLVETKLSRRSQRSPIRRLNSSQSEGEPFLCFGVVRGRMSAVVGIPAAAAAAVSRDFRVSTRSADGHVVRVRRPMVVVPGMVVRDLIVKAFVLQ